MPYGERKGVLEKIKNSNRVLPQYTKVGNVDIFVLLKIEN